jgi:hypothetical protein
LCETLGCKRTYGGHNSGWLRVMPQLRVAKAPAKYVIQGFSPDLSALKG